VIVGVEAGSEVEQPAATRASTASGAAALIDRYPDKPDVHDAHIRRLEPDRYRLDLPGDCFGKGALAALRKLTPPGTRITLERDPTLDSTDRYGRQLRYVFVGGTNINVALVRQGAASPYFYRGDRGRYATELLGAVDEARASNRGYWSACPDARFDPGRGSITGPG